MKKTIYTALISALVFTTVVLFFGIGCGRLDAPPARAQEQTQENEDVVKVTAIESGAEEESKKPFRAEIHADGLPHNLPRAFTIHFSRPVIEAKLIGTKDESDTILIITPEIKGERYWEDRYTLVFRPDVMMPFDTRFEVELLQVATKDGIVKGPRPGGWKAWFKTPPFILKDAVLERMNVKNKEVDVALLFTGLLANKQKAELIDIRINNRKIEKFHMFARGEQLIIRVKNPLVKNQSILKLKVAKGIRSESGGYLTTEPFEKLIELGKPEKLRISSIYLEESTSGYYFDVTCNDYSLERYWYKCDVPIEHVKEMVSVVPPANATFIPQRRGFRILGDFHQGVYVITVNAGLTSNDGGILTETITRRMEVPRRTPRVSFQSKGRYLPGHRLSRVPIRHINVGEIEVKVSRIPEQNIMFWLSGYEEKANDRIADVVASQKFELTHREDVQLTSWLDLSQLLPKDNKGVFEFAFKGDYRTDAIRLILTQLSLVAKRSGKEGENLSVWVFDSEKLTPKRAATVELMSKSNRVIGKAYTNSDGLAEFKNITDPVDEKQKSPFAVMARAGNDFTVLKFSDLEIGLSEYQVQGSEYDTESAYRAAIYMDRGVYRPGETAHLIGIVWEKANRAPKKSLPIIGKLIDPQGKEVERLTGRTNSAGMVNFDLAFQDYAPTGKHTFHLEIGDNKIAKHSFLVEEFVPERMKVKVKPLKDNLLISDPATFEVNARYLFGSTARGERMEAECTLAEGKFSPAQHSGFTFGIWRPIEFQPMPLGKFEGQLDEEGSGEVTCAPVSEVVLFKGPGKVRVMASVFEAGSGRTTVSRSSMPVHPDKYYLGLQGPSSEASSGQLYNVDGIVVNLDGKIVKEIKKVKIELHEVQADWVWEYDPSTGRNKWRNYLREVLLSEEEVKVGGGKFKYSFMPSGYSYGYVVRAMSGERIQTDLYIKGGNSYWYAYGEYGSRADRTPKPSMPEGLIIDAPGSIRTGTPARISIKLPYPGKLLLTLETDRVIESKWHDVKGETFTTDINLKEFVPNVYVSALLIKDPFYESADAFIPGRAFAVQSVKVIPEQHELVLHLNLPTEVMPNSELVVELDVGEIKGPVFATVAAIDEGVLQLTNYKTPDPLAVIFQKRKLGVKTFETVGWTLLSPGMFEEKTQGGGDGPEDEFAKEQDGYQSRIHAIKPVALWSGIVNVGADGKAKIKFNVPTYRGELRVVAVAAAPDRMGSASGSVKVRDPIVLQPTFPRFLMTDDIVVLPVSLTNLTGRKEKIEVELIADKTIEIKDAAVKSIKLDPGQSGTVTFLCRVLGTYGGAHLKVEARGSKDISHDSATVPLLPNAPVTRDVQMRKLQPGENDLTKYLEGWMPQYEQTTVTVLPNRYGREMGHLKYLIRYPYGCIEQTSSTTRPLLYISNLVSSIDPEILKNGTVEQKFMHGIKRLFSMQTSDGGFAYWPGENRSTYWGTTYVTHIMLEGIEAGYPINKRRVDSAIGFIERTLTSSPNYVDSSYGYSVTASEPYMHYVLAKAGKARPARIRTLIKNKNKNWGKAETENLYLLKAALYLSGDRTYEKDLKNVPLEIPDKRENGWTFWSALRTRGMMLNIMEDLFPGSPDSEPLAQAVADMLRGTSGYYTTQELSWCVSALGKRVAGSAKNWTKPSLTLNAKPLNPLPRAKKSMNQQTWRVSGASGGKKLLLTIDSIEGGDLYALVQVEGIKPGVPYKTGDSHLKVRRRYLTAKGEEIGASNLRLGDTVYIELTLTNLTNLLVRNVVLEDRFAAGFDIENPRLGRDRALGWIDANSLWEPTYVNMRDDHIEIFGHLDPGQKVKFVYVTRAVVGGKFATPPVRAEAMYDPRLYSQQLGKPVTILDPWQALTD